MIEKLNVLIVEDEPIAASQLSYLISSIVNNVDILSVCDTIESTLKWIENNEAPDLAFFDIHLGDGLSFEVFKQIKFDVPVIFTTAFDQYSLQAFKVNSIDYILKPIDEKELRFALEKFQLQKIKKSSTFSDEKLQRLFKSIDKQEYKKRFLIKVGTHLKAIQSEDIYYFFSFEKGTFMMTNNHKSFLLDYTLEHLEQLVDPEKFYRISRKYIVSIESIEDITVYSNTRLKLKIKNATESDFLVSREKVKAFKKWLEGSDER